jgi:hypothetical protein
MTSIAPQIAVVRFPAVAAAVARCEATLAGHQAASQALRRDSTKRTAARVAQDAHAAANAAAVSAYAAELLPAIFGGGWMRAASGSLIPYGRLEHRAMLSWPLIDHGVSYRRRGERGPLTWRNGVLLAEPYSIGGDDGAHTSEARAQARLLRAELSLGVWCCPALSRWFPTRTTLLLIARDLRPSRAAEFGFEAWS